MTGSKETTALSLLYVIERSRESNKIMTIMIKIMIIVMIMTMMIMIMTLCVWRLSSWSRHQSSSSRVSTASLTLVPSSETQIVKIFKKTNYNF